MSGEIYFIADTHFGHENMSKKRGFSCAEEHDELIIDYWNTEINKKDTVYLLGDVTMESKKPYPTLRRLNGYINVVLGNHDRRQDIRSLIDYVNSISGPINFKKEFFLTHVPVHPIELSYKRLNYNIHGHVHENTINDPKYLCVSCEQEHMNYTPISLEEVRNIFSRNNEQKDFL